MGGGGAAKGEKGKRRLPPPRDLDRDPPVYKPAQARQDESWDSQGGRDSWYDDPGPPGKGREGDRERGGPWEKGQGKGYEPRGYEPRGYEPRGYEPKDYEPKGYGKGHSDDDELWALAKTLASRFGRPPKSNGYSAGWERETQDHLEREPRDRWEREPRDHWEGGRRDWPEARHHQPDPQDHWERELRDGFDREINDRWHQRERSPPPVKGKKGAGKEGHSGGKGKLQMASPKIYVGSLPADASEDLVRDSFEMFGEIVDVKMMFDDRGDSKGFCYVTYAAAEDAQRVLDNHEFNQVDGAWVDCRTAPSFQSVSGTSSAKPGDWICPECGDNVFAKRTACNRCGYSGPAGERVAKGEGKGGKGGKAGRPGDWICSACGDVVFASRDSCKRCGEPRTESAKRMGSKPGDWTCPSCGDLVFASKNACGLCRTPKPEREDGPGARARAAPY